MHSSSDLSLLCFGIASVKKGRALLLDQEPTGEDCPSRQLRTDQYLLLMVTLDNYLLIAYGLCTGDNSFKRPTYQLSTVGYVPTVVITGNGESGFDSGEGA